MAVEFSVPNPVGVVFEVSSGSSGNAEVYGLLVHDPTHTEKRERLRELSFSLFHVQGNA